ncbi:hypothetical protein ACP3S7_10755 [Phytobacter ursingii]
MQKIFIDGMQGIGDNIFQRPFIKALCQQGNQVWVKTSIPEFYADLPNIHFVKSETRLRTQQKNEERSQVAFEDAPTGVFIRKRIFYGNADLQRPGGIFAQGRALFGVEPAELDIPSWNLPDIGIPQGAKVALIRPTTERMEWHNAARGPLNYHVNEASLLLAARGYFCISIADLHPGVEWIPDEEPFAHLRLHRGELSIMQMMALVERSDIVVSGSGVISQASFAYRKPLVFLGGGCGGSNHHSKITDPAIMDLSRCLFVYPDNYCMCQFMKHDCNKRISNLRGKITEWLDAKNL